MDLAGQEEAPIDPGAQKAVQTYDEKDFEGHRQHSVFVGAHLPVERRHSHRRHKHHHRGSISSSTDDDRPCTPPAQRVQFILGEDVTDDSHESHPLFSEMLELIRLGPDGDDYEWKETARWIKFEEDVEEGGNRWSKPHVATLSLHSLFELRSHLLNGTVLLDMEATTLDQLVDLCLEHAVNTGLLGASPPERRDIIRGLLLKRCRHQHQTKRLLPMIRSFADIGRNHSTSRSGCIKPLLSCVSKPQPTHTTHQTNQDMYTKSNQKKTSRLSFQPSSTTPRRVSSALSMKSMSRNGSFASGMVPTRHLNRQNSGTYMPLPVDEPTCENHHHDKQTDHGGHGGHFLAIPGQGSFNLTSDSHSQTQTLTSIPKSISSHTMLSRNHSSNDLVNGDVSPGSQHQQQHNMQFMRKIPQSAEAGNILVGEVDCLDRPLSAFVRLRSATILGDLTEVPVPTRFIFILLTPVSTALNAISTNSSHQEIGRAMATLMSDEIFHEVAYRARNRSHILAGVDEFLDAVTVLPPGEWDPSIRIEPPAAIPSQDTRKRPQPEKPLEELDEELEEQRLREESGLSRSGRLFGGLINDLKRKAPFYWSDFRDGASLQCIASWIFLYFACLSPIITFGGLLSQATGRNMAAMESLVSGFICGLVYGLFSGQPLTILGSTGPVLIFESIVYDYCDYMEWDYLSFRFWIGAWVALILFILVAVDASALVCYITRFTEENFACLIAFIFIFKAFENVKAIGEKYPINNSGSTNLSYECSCYANSTIEFLSPNITNWTDLTKAECLRNNGTLIGDGCNTTVYFSDIYLMTIILFLGTFILSIFLKDFKSALFFPTKVRQLISDFSIIIVIILMSMLDYYMGVPTPKLEVPHEFKPTLPSRGWLVSPFKNHMYSVLLAVLPALLGTILLFMDQQITTVIINRKENKLKKGCGYHLDLFVLSILILICSAMGIPWFCAATVLSINHVNSLKLESECAAPGEKPQFLGVREQRFTHVMIFITIGFSVFLTPILGHIPMPVLFGVFLYMGITSLRGIQFFDRILIIFMPNKYQPDYMYLRKVPIKRVHLFTLIQFTCLCCLWSIKSFSSTSILFPLMLVVMIGIRKSLDWIFTQRELKILDDVMPEFSRRGEHGSAGDAESKFELGPSGHLKIPLANGNVMNIPLSAINITEEVNKSGTWKQLNTGRKKDKDNPREKEPIKEPKKIKEKKDPNKSSGKFKKKKHNKKEEKRTDERRKLEKRLSTMAEEEEEEGIHIKADSLKKKECWIMNETKSDEIKLESKV